MRKRSVPLPASPGMLPVAILAAGRKKVSGTFFRQYMFCDTVPDASTSQLGARFSAQLSLALTKTPYLPILIRSTKFRVTFRSERS